MTNENDLRGIDARLERIEDLVRELDELLRGSRRNKHSGIVADQERMDLELRKLNAVVFVDSTGKRGIAHDVDYLMDRRTGSERRSEFRWKYWFPTLMAILAMTVTILTNLDKIKANLPKHQPSALDRKIQRAKHPKGKKIVRVRIVSPPPASSEPSTKESPPSP